MSSVYIEAYFGKIFELFDVVGFSGVFSPVAYGL
jgi:hypothetical protein